MKRISKLLALGAFFMLAAGVWLSSPGAGVPILEYHQVVDDQEMYSISPADFASQMEYLARHGYTAISLKEFCDVKEGKYKLPAKPVIITFDDGYDDNYFTALPIMERYGMRASVFVISGLVGEPDYLTWDQIRELAQHQIEVGSHTVNHVPLGQVDSAECQQEVAESKQVIEAQLGKKVEFLTYPYGSFNAAAAETLRRAGYRGALTGVVGLNFSGDNTYTLKRINVPRPKLGLLEFRVRLFRALLYSKLEI
ncbi:MAG: polysaccharide deacetylase family protein [Veillonellales bacterium]